MANREAILKRDRERYRLNRKQILKRLRENYWKHRESRTKAYAEGHARRRVSWFSRLSRLVSGAGSRSRRLGISFNLDKTWIETTAARLEADPTCPVTGVEFDLSKGQFRGAPSSWAPSLDRIDPRKGYTKGNVRVISMWANKAKGVHSDAVFEEWILCAATNIKQRRKRARNN